MKKILIVDDHPIVRRGLKQIIIDEFNSLIIDEAEYGRQVFDFLEKENYDLIILDLSLPDVNGLEILDQLHVSYPDQKVLIFSAMSEDQYGMRILKSGAMGFMHKESAPEELIKAMNLIRNGRKYISADLAEKLAVNIDDSKNDNTYESLSNREFEVLILIGKGKGIKQIAEELSLSVQTVSTYRTRILSKMNMKTNAELTRYCIKENLVE